MANFQDKLLKLVFSLLLLLILAQALLLFDKPRRFLSRVDRLEGKPWRNQLAPAATDVVNYRK